MSIIYTQNKYNTEALFAEYPELKGVLHQDRRMNTNDLGRVSLFTDSRIENDDILICGRLNNKRTRRYFPKRFVDTNHKNLYKWKILIPRVNRDGNFGEPLGPIEILLPGYGYTKTYIGLGAFETRAEAENAQKYVKTKFARAALSLMKVTQQTERNTWQWVPIQDFSLDSDLDWSKSISEIDKQLYRKYGLTPKEISFVETNVAEMM